MKDNKTEQYTFGADEKEILQKLDTVESSVGQYTQEKNQRELISTKYYSEFVIDTPNGPVTLRNVFITAERDQQGQVSYHFRWIRENENGEQTIEENLVVDAEGKVYTKGGLKDYLGDAEIDIEELMAINDKEKGRLKGISEKAELEEMQKNLDGKEEHKDGDKSLEDDEETEQESEQDEETQEMEEDLKEQGEDLELVNVKKIKDSHVAERMPDVFGDSDEHAQAYSRKLNKFVMLEKNYSEENSNGDKGKWQLNDKVQPAQTTMRTIINIGENGERVERKVPHALMKTNRDDKEIAVTIGQYGEVNIETVDVLPCQERIARGVREQGENLEKEESAEVRREFETQGKEYKHDIAHQVEKIEDAQRDAKQTVDYDITPDDVIPNTDGKTWGELMENTGESLPKLIERYNRDMAKEGAESKDVVNTIEYDYGNVSREHKR